MKLCYVSKFQKHLQWYATSILLQAYVRILKFIFLWISTLQLNVFQDILV